MNEQDLITTLESILDDIAEDIISLLDESQE